MNVPPQPTIFDFIPSTSTNAQRQPAFNRRTGWNNLPTTTADDSHLRTSTNRINPINSRSDTTTNLLSDLPDVPSSSANSKRMESLIAGAVGTGGNVLSSLVSGGFNLGSSFVHSSAQRDIANNKLEFANKQLDWDKQQWNTEWKTARSLGLSHPGQLANPLSGGFYSLQGRTFAPSSRSSARNVWN